jgi:hypothetical protein
MSEALPLLRAALVAVPMLAVRLLRTPLTRSALTRSTLAALLAATHGVTWRLHSIAGHAALIAEPVSAAPSTTAPTTATATTAPSSSLAFELTGRVGLAWLSRGRGLDLRLPLRVDAVGGGSLGWRSAFIAVIAGDDLTVGRGELAGRRRDRRGVIGLVGGGARLMTGVPSLWRTVTMASGAVARLAPAPVSSSHPRPPTTASATATATPTPTAAFALV